MCSFSTWSHFSFLVYSYYLPRQKAPSGEISYPVLHIHRYPPTEFSQNPLAQILWWFSSHSFMSKACSYTIPNHQNHIMRCKLKLNTHQNTTPFKRCLSYQEKPTTDHSRLVDLVTVWILHHSYTCRLHPCFHRSHSGTFLLLRIHSCLWENNLF